MDLSIVICTHDRAHALAETLAALARCHVPGGFAVETIVVANACRDDTGRVARAAGVHVLSEPTLGLSRARNTGLKAAQGAAILWLDDDVTPAPGLVAAYADALARHPDALCFGGPIRPRLLPPSPAWAEAALTAIPTVWSARDFGPGDRALDIRAKEYPFGANFLVRRAAFDIGFRNELGRRGHAGLLVGGEERALCERIATNGGTLRWVAAASVDHRIGPERQTLAYVARYFQGSGFQAVLAQGGARPVSRARSAVRLGRAIARYGALRVFGRPRHWLPAYAALHRGLGARRAHRVCESEGGAAWATAAG